MAIFNRKWIYSEQWIPSFMYANSALGKQCSAKINGNDCSGDYSLRFQSQSFRTDPTDRQTKVATTKICLATICEYVEGY